MTKSEARKIFRDKFTDRINNETFFLRISCYISDDNTSFTNDKGLKIKLPADQTRDGYATDLVVDLKKYCILNWKPEYGFVHVNIKPDSCAQYELLDEIGECFCSLSWYPPKDVVPCNIGEDGKDPVICFDIQPNGKLRDWPAPADFTAFKKHGRLHFTSEDKKWIKAQMDSPDGDPIIREIPYNTCVSGSDKDGNLIGKKKFTEFKPAMEFVRQLRDNPNTDQISAVTDLCWHTDFWRHFTFLWTNEDGVEEECEDEQSSFSHIDEWIEEELFDHVKRYLLPDDIDLEIEEIDDMLSEGQNQNGTYDDLPF